MIIVERIRADTHIRQIPGQADTLKLRIERPLGHAIVCQGIQDICRDLFTAGEIYGPDLTAVYAVSEQQDLKIRAFRVFVHTAFRQADRGICLDINFNVSHKASYKTRRQGCPRRPYTVILRLFPAPLYAYGVSP